MRKTAFLLALLLASAAFSGCNIRIYPTWKGPDDSVSGDSADPLQSGWTSCAGSAAPADIPADVQEGFDSAVPAYANELLTPMEFEAAALLGTQVVAGQNQALLCVGSSVFSSNAPDWYVIILYRDLQQNVTVRNINPVVISALAEKEAVESPDEMLAGGWTVNADAAKGASLASDAKKVFDDALKGLTGASYSPIVLLGTQEAETTRYAFLCKSAAIAPGSVPALTVVFAEKDPEGACSISSIVPFDISDYTN